MRRKSFVILLVALCLICLTCVLCSCGDKTSQTQTTPPTAEDTPSTGGDTTHVHAYGSWSITRSATCSVEGLKTRRCVTCGNVETETIPKTAHTPVIDAAVEATCTQEGKTQGSHCGVCGTVIVAQTKVDKKEHTVVIDQAIPATCTEPGKTQGSHCDVCKTVLQEQQETRALGHTAGAEWYSNDDTHWHECIRCHTHMEEVSHTYGNWQTQSTPTIDTEGIDRQYCTCGKYHERKVDKLPPFTFVMDGTVYSVKAYLGHDSVVEVPSTYNGVTVAVIGSYAFQYQTGITDIILPETILKIDYGAFSYCTSLQNVNIPKCMTFEDLVFDNCTSLKEIVMPDNLTSCGKNIFNNCTALTKVTFTGGNVTGILGYNDTVQEIIVEDGVRSVSKYAFIGCTSLKYLTLPRIESSATSFAEYYLGVTPKTYTYSYNGIDAYTDRDLIEPEAVDIYSMNGRVFGIPRSGCNWYVNSRKLGTVTNGGITYTYTDKPIKVSKWYNWYDISVDRYYNIPQTWSAEYSYLPDTPIEKLTVTNQMISRYDSVFDNCTCKLDIWQKFPIKQLFVTGNSSPFVDEFNEEYYTLIVEHTDNYIEKFPLFDYVDEDDRATAGELGQHQLTVTYQDASIEYALEILLHQFDDAVFNSHEFIFDGETKYMSVDMLTGLPEGTDVVFDGDGQSELGHYEVTATLSKQYYESKTLTATMDIFPPTFSLTYVLGIDEAMHENPSDYQTNGDGVELAAATLAGFGFVDWYTEPEFTNKITKIEGNAHQDYTLYAKWQLPFDITDGSIKVNAFGKKQTEIVIPNRVYNQTITAIASEAFKDCSSLQAVTIGDGVTSIGDSAFSGCTGLKEIIISDCVTTINNSAFYGCTGVQTITIGEGVASIGVDAFKNCSGITKVNFLGILEVWCGIVFGNASANPLYYGNAKLYLNDEEVTEVKDLDGLNSIPAYAFCGCTSLQTVTIGENVTSIGVDAFYGCTGLQTVTIGESVTTIGEYAFCGCTSLQTVTIGENVTSIGVDAFKNCSGITKVNFLGTLKDWCEIVFGNASANPLYDANYNKVRTAKLYLNDEEVTGDVNIPSGTSKISNCAFYGLTGITTVTIPDSVTSIGEHSFHGCTGLQTATINAQIIGEYAFYECTGLQSVTIGDGVQKIESSSFGRCSDLKAISVEEGNAIYQSKDGILYKSSDKSMYIVPKALEGEVVILDGCAKINDSAFDGRNGLTAVTIPDSTRSIGNSAFSGCTDLQTVNWNATNCTKAGDYRSYPLQDYTIFQGCTGLTTVNIGENVQSIPSYTFYKCTSLQTITIVESVQSIGSSAFYGCTSLHTVNWNATNCKTAGNSSSRIFSGCTKLTTVNIGENVQSIPEYTFYDCTAITKVNYLWTLKDWCEIEFGNSYANPLYEANYNKAGTAKLYLNAEEVTEVKDLDGLESIPDYAFYGLTGITTVTIPDSVTSIGSSAFSGCNNLKAIYVEESNATYQSKDGVVYKSDDKSIYLVPAAIEGEIAILDGCAKINDSAFNSRNGLTAVTIPDSTQSIEKDAFCWCTSITSVTIPDGVQSIGEHAFYGCIGLQTITIGESVKSIDKKAFDGCTGLQTVNWNAKNCTEAGGYDSIFKESTQLKTVNIGNVVQSIPAYAFYGCNRVQSVTIGEGVQSIGNRAFSCCSDLREITIPSNVKNMGRSTFNSCISLQTATINAPSIGEAAFNGCTGMQKVTIGENVQSIGENAFDGCTGLQTVSIGKNVKSIEGWAFWHCRGLRTVTIGTSVKSIGPSAFSECTSLTDIYYAGDKTQWGSIDKRSGWDYNTPNYKSIHYNSTGPASASAASNISTLPSDQPVFIACDRLDLWVKQD